MSDNKHLEAELDALYNEVSNIRVEQVRSLSRTKTLTPTLREDLGHLVTAWRTLLSTIDVMRKSGARVSVDGLAQLRESRNQIRSLTSILSVQLNAL